MQRGGESSVPVEWKWIIILAAALIGAVMAVFWSIRTIRIMHETRILQRKYGDLPMFADFFRRLEAEENRKKGGLS